MPKLILPKSVKYIAFFIATLLALLAMLGVGVTYAYHDKYYPGVTVNGVEVGGLTKAEAETKVTALMADTRSRKITVAVPDIAQPRKEDTGDYPVQNVEATAEEIGLSISADQALADAWSMGHNGNSWAWVRQISHLFFVGGQSYTSAPTIDETKLAGFVETKVVAKAVSPTPATLQVNGAAVSIADGTPGLAIDSAKLTDQLKGALGGSLGGDALSFKVAQDLTDSKITRTTIQPIADTLDKLGNTRVSLTATGVQLSPNRTELLQWYTPVMSDTGDVSLGLNSDRISAYIQKSSSQLDQKASSTAVTKAATDWLSNAVTSATVALTLKPKAEVVAGSYQAGLFEGKYVYVNLAEQKLYRMSGSTLEKVYRVSTGKWSTPTPRGTFFIKSKAKRPFSATHGLYMPWWQNFTGTSDDGEELPNGSYGLHELPEWPNGYKEGQGHLGTAVSHGCVRLGIGDAKEIYDWTEIGTAVVIQ